MVDPDLTWHGQARYHAGLLVRLGGVALSFATAGWGSVLLWGMIVVWRFCDD